MAFLVKVDGIGDGKPIPNIFASCVADMHGGTQDAGNISPAISWIEPPDGARSFAIVVDDRDVPADFSKANTAHERIPYSAERRTFYHWLLADIPEDVTALVEGEAGIGVKGQNDFGERARGANGYDGPCPPWNDLRPHLYHFTVYALDVPTLGLTEGFSGQDLMAAIETHVLARAEAVGVYATNAELLPLPTL